MELVGAAEAQAIGKSSVTLNGGLPGWIVIPDSIGQIFAGWMKPSAAK